MAPHRQAQSDPSPWPSSGADPIAQLSLRALRGIDAIEPAVWRELVGPEPLPFLRHEWISALERSGSASPASGWEPRHLTLWRDDCLIAAAPAYRKHHSMGEYVYDFAWASAARSGGIRYYPKLLAGLPLSPATAPRFLTRPGEKEVELRAALADGLWGMTQEEGGSSAHIIFATEAEALELELSGWAHRLGMQYHWRNPGYRDYSDFLSRFDSKRRNQLKRERSAAAQQGIDIRTLTGVELRGRSATSAELAYRLYETTCEKNPWGQLQLNLEFFERVFDSMAESVELVVAEGAGRIIAGAFNLLSPGRRYGRYWGCFEEHPFLHFNVCFYHSIEQCIAEGRTLFEPGAGGEHKIARGFQPTAIHSLHRIVDERLDRAVRDFVEREREEVASIVTRSEEVAGMKPWRVPR